MINRTLIALDSVTVDIILICIVFLLLILLKNRKEQDKAARWLPVVLIAAYAVIYFFLVFCREPYPEPRAELTPFWSYRAAAGEGFSFSVPSLSREILQNVLLFIPLGMLLTWLFPQHPILYPVLICLLLSVLTETVQYCTRTGLAEFDDVFNNMLGCMAGTLTISCMEKQKTVRCRRNATRGKGG